MDCLAFTQKQKEALDATLKTLEECLPLTTFIIRTDVARWSAVTQSNDYLVQFVSSDSAFSLQPGKGDTRLYSLYTCIYKREGAHLMDWIVVPQWRWTLFLWVKVHHSLGQSSTTTNNCRHSCSLCYLSYIVYSIAYMPVITWEGLHSNGIRLRAINRYIHLDNKQKVVKHNSKTISGLT